MKKKIKELSKEESEKICSKNINCDNCPFLFQDRYCLKDFLESEVEIDEQSVN